VYGLDLVQWQLRIASGERLLLSQEDIRPRGWAIETRIYAEDPANHMLPSTGTITEWSPPEGPGIRVDSGVRTGSEVSVYYDSMLAKLIVFGSDRAHAIARLDRALAGFTIEGIRANVPLLAWIARDEWFVEGKTTTSFLAQRLDESIFTNPHVPDDVLAFAVGIRLADGDVAWRVAGVGSPVWLQASGQIFKVEASRLGQGQWLLAGALSGTLTAQRHGERVNVTLDGRAIPDAGRHYDFSPVQPPSADTNKTGLGAGPGDGRVTSPMPGKIVKVAVKEGDSVEPHALLLVLEAMKMEHRIEASAPATVKALLVKEGDIVTGGAALVELA